MCITCITLVKRSVTSRINGSRNVASYCKGIFRWNIKVVGLSEEESQNIFIGVRSVNNSDQSFNVYGIRFVHNTDIEDMPSDTIIKKDFKLQRDDIIIMTLDLQQMDLSFYLRRSEKKREIDVIEETGEIKEIEKIEIIYHNLDVRIDNLAIARFLWKI